MDNTMSSTQKDLSRKVDSFADRAESKADSLKARAKNLINSDLADELSERWHQLRDRSADVYDSSVDVVRRHPVATVGTALAVGVLAGMILKRRH